MKDDYDAFTFDLDGTLAESKSSITPEVSDFLRRLLERGKTIGIISGGRLSQFEKQLLDNFTCDPDLWYRVYLMPTCGAAMYAWRDGAWKEQYAHRISTSEYARILKVFDTVFEQTSFPRPEARWGEQVEHRDTQVTFSAYGQQAPVEEKVKWEEDGQSSKKQELVRLLSPLLPEYSVKAGGMTSVDITHQGIDKQYGIERFLQETGHTVGNTLFVGDALYEGGNDYAVTKTGVDVCQVDGVDDLLAKLSHFAHTQPTWHC